MESISIAENMIGNCTLLSEDQTRYLFNNIKYYEDGGYNGEVVYTPANVFIYDIW